MQKKITLDRAFLYTLFTGQGLFLFTLNIEHLFVVPLFLRICLFVAVSYLLQIFVPLHKPRKVGFSDAIETAKRRYENFLAPLVL